MRDFAFGPAVVASLDLLRRRPVATLVLALVGVAATLASRVTAVFAGHFMVQHFSQPGAIPVINTASAAVNLLVLLLVISVVAPAIFRGGRIRMGGDELRSFALSMVVLLQLVVILLMICVGAAITATRKLKGGAEDGVMFTALGLGVILAFALASRLSLAGPMTVRDGRMRFMASWRLTRERPWKIFGAFLVTLLMAALVGGGGGFLLNMGTIALKIDASLPYDPSLAVALKAVILPGGLVLVLLQGLLTGLAVVIPTASTAYIHRQLVGDPVADQAAVFD